MSKKKFLVLLSFACVLCLTPIGNEAVPLLVRPTNRSTTNHTTHPTTHKTTVRSLDRSTTKPGVRPAGQKVAWPVPVKVTGNHSKVGDHGAAAQESAHHAIRLFPGGFRPLTLKNVTKAKHRDVKLLARPDEVIQPPGDGAAPADGTAPPDGGAPADGAAPAEGAAPADGAAPAEGAAPADGASPADGAAPVSGAPPANVIPMAEGGPEAPPGEESTAAAGAEGEAPGAGGGEPPAAGEGGSTGEGAGGGGAGEGGAGGGGAGEGEAGDDDGKDETVAATERTISIPKFETDEFGNWVYNPWAVTFGKIWQDTRFNIVGRYTIPRMRLESKMVFDYYLSASKYSTVCMGRSTVYNKPRVMKWLSNNVYNQTHEHRPVWLGIRREIYEHGNSEECHTSKFNAFRRYFECAMRRNQRVEYMIPQYPLHQLGYNGHYWGNLPREEKEQH